MVDPGGVCLLILGTLIFVTEAVQELSTEECFAVGLNKANLLCSSCDTLKEFNLDILEANSFPQVQAFVKSDRPAAFPNLTIKYVRGADPVIKLMDEDGDVMETLAIDKWNTDSVEEFLNTYLLLPGQNDGDEEIDGSANEI
ncbi:hypothetical protein Pcinc_040418 [Petrolisthes cinctipes]|uniref:Selenoprotein F n=1 Tax=Petrolisthes cinctipes TaxID=88211 RepID=A0AAE1EI13_PETCI|nr:hypothetical protein Pcinc_040418 [Petrolisthes cinctipes]